MSKYYGSTVAIDGNTGVATRRGFKGIRSAAQTFDGSLIAVARDNKDGKTIFEIEINKYDSNLYGKTMFSGTLKDLEKILRGAKHEDED